MRDKSLEKTRSEQLPDPERYHSHIDQMGPKALIIRKWMTECCWLADHASDIMARREIFSTDGEHTVLNQLSSFPPASDGMIAAPLTIEEDDSLLSPKLSRNYVQGYKSHSRGTL